MIAAGTLAGFGESHKLICREKSLSALMRFLSSARAEICYAALPVERLLEKHGTLAFMKECVSLYSGGLSFQEAWRKALSNAKGLCLDKEDFALAMDFGLGLGTSDTQGQLSHFDLFQSLLEIRLQNAREEKTRKLNLYRSLGLFSGLAVALVLC